MPVTTGTSRLPRALRPFRHRDYALLAASMAASLFASGLWIVALVYQVIELGGGPAQLSLVSAAAATGLLLSVLLGGVAADRISRRLLLRLVETVRIAMAGLAAGLALTGTLELWSLAAVAFVVGAAEAFFFPAYSAVLPTLLPADELLAANGLEGILRPVAMYAAGPALAGVLVAGFGPGYALGGAAAGYLLALVPLLFMRVPPETEREPSSVLSDLGEGFRYFLHTGWLFATLLFAVLLVLLVIGPIEVLLPFAVRDQTASGPGGYALVLALFGAGGAVGSLLASVGRMPRRYLTVMILLWGVGGVPLALVGFADQLWTMGAIVAVVGAAHGAAMVIWGTLLQRRVPPHLLGRVSSLDFFVSLALMPVSTALAGPVGEAVGIPTTFLLAGLVPLPLAVLALLIWRLPKDELAHPL
ncbi:MFS transporter [Pseudonocardia oroxyli]|uniref:Predicted arabinose efflux permease, MFS family n=1 Tax=Pseudonocardia oroxyli TaxID=366584 RepID=A0A1G7GJR8_PSEOR|nr:MFS transporter [Pseudonocardia oroxyli]SDE88249.1 Predicted arabinose efflux permease, MFS family [Pseudonocardia oroxyli]